MRQKLTEGIYVSDDASDNLGRLENAMLLKEKAEVAIDKIKQAIRLKTLPRGRAEDLYDLAYEKNIINLDEKNLISDMSEAVLDAMQVDEYSLEDYVNI